MKKKPPPLSRVDEVVGVPRLWVSWLASSLVWVCSPGCLEGGFGLGGITNGGIFSGVMRKGLALVKLPRDIWRFMPPDREGGTLAVLNRSRFTSNSYPPIRVRRNHRYSTKQSRKTFRRNNLWESETMRLRCKRIFAI